MHGLEGNGVAAENGHLLRDAKADARVARPCLWRERESERKATGGRVLESIWMHSRACESM